MNARKVASALVILAFTACGGGGGTGGVTPIAPTHPTTSNTATQSVSISLIVPANSGAAAVGRRPAYISASAEGAGIVVTQGSTTVNATLDLSSGSSACTGGGGTRMCTTAVVVPIGSDLFTTTIYNQAPAAGTIPSGAHILGIGSTTVNVVAGQTTSVPVFVGGEVAGFGATAAAASLPANGSAQTVPIVIAPTDFGDNPIVTGTSDPYSNAITVAIAETGGGGHASVSLNNGAAASSVLVTQSTDTINVHYDGGGSPGYAFTITLSATGVSSQTMTVAPLIAAIAGTAIRSVPLNGAAKPVTLQFGEAAGSATYTSSLTGCAPTVPTTIATTGAVSGSGASATLSITGGPSASASGCSVTITDSNHVALAIPITNTPIGGTVNVNGTTITEYTGYAAPYGITKGPDGNIWFTDSGTVYAIASGLPATIVHQYAVGDALFGITTGSDGALWVADQTNGGVDRITTSGVITQYPFTGTPQGIASDPFDGTLLVADNTSGGIWQLTVGGSYTVFPFAPSGVPAEVTWAPQGAQGTAWFAEGTYVGAYDIGLGTVNEQISVPNGSTSQYIAYGKDGKMWFTASGGSAPFIGVIDPTTGAPYTVVQVALNASAVPVGITAGADNAMWFVDGGTSTVGEINLTSHVVSTFPITNGSNPREIVTGPDGSLWFTENASGSIGHIVP